MGYTAAGQEGDRIRLAAAATDGIGLYVDLLYRPGQPGGRFGVGSIHHIAFRTVDDSEQQEYLDALHAAGFDVSPVRDRQYFHSIYFRSPGGVLFEVATDAPGFLLDEPAETLGEAPCRSCCLHTDLWHGIWPNPKPIAKTHEEEIANMKYWISARLHWMDAALPGALPPAPAVLGPMPDWPSTDSHTARLSFHSLPCASGLASGIWAYPSDNAGSQGAGPAKGGGDCRGSRGSPALSAWE